MASLRVRLVTAECFPADSHQQGEWMDTERAQLWDTWFIRWIQMETWAPCSSV